MSELACDSTVASILFLLNKKLVDHFVFLSELGFDHQESCSELRVFIFKVVGGHSLFHYIIVETLALLMDDSWSQFADTDIDHVGGFGAHGHSSHSNSGRKASLLAKLHVVASGSSSWPLLSSFGATRRIVHIGLLLNRAKATNHVLIVATCRRRQQILLTVVDLAELLLLHEQLVRLTNPALVLLSLHLLHLLESQLFTMSSCFGALRSDAVTNTQLVLIVQANHMTILLLHRVVVSAANDTTLSQDRHVSLTRVMMQLVSTSSLSSLLLSLIIFLLIVLIVHIISDIVRILLIIVGILIII